jgi:glucose-1-phosphatase
MDFNVRCQRAAKVEKNSHFCKSNLHIQFVKMVPPTSHIPHDASLKNIIFDFGGVICDLHIWKTEEKFLAFGAPADDTAGSKEKGEADFEVLSAALETGMITPSHFCSAIRKFYRSAPPDEEILDAWNALLTRIPAERIRLLESLRKSYRIFLLSNSNLIHYTSFRQDFEEDFGYRDFDELFERAWFSFRIGLKKPDPAIFAHVLKDKNLNPAETLFIDDTLMHVETARTLGIRGHHLRKGDTLTGLFKEW